MAYALAIGNKLIRDIVNPSHEDIDSAELWPRLGVTRRFSNNPKALTVLEHVHLVKLLAEKAGMPPGVLWWCLHHDDHEAIITDIPGPLKHLIADHTDVLSVVEERLDLCICQALSHVPPDQYVRRIVHIFDKMAETVEWQFVLGYNPEPWNMELPFPASDVPPMLHRCKKEAFEALNPPKKSKSVPPAMLDDNDDFGDEDGLG